MESQVTENQGTKKLSLKNLIAFAEENQLRYECYAPKFDRFNDRAKFEGFFFIGVQLEANAYFWFKGYDIEGVQSEYQELFWDHRYNQNSGYISKGFSYYFKALDYFRGDRKLTKKVKQY